MLRRNTIASLASVATMTACVLPEYTSDRSDSGDGGNDSAAGYRSTGVRGGAAGKPNLRGGTAGVATVSIHGGNATTGMSSAGSGNWNALGGVLNNAAGSAGSGTTASSDQGGSFGLGGVTNSSGAQPSGGTSSGGLAQTGGTSSVSNSGGFTQLGGTTSFVASAGTTSWNGGSSVGPGGSTTAGNIGVSGGGTSPILAAGAAGIFGGNSTTGGNATGGNATGGAETGGTTTGGVATGGVSGGGAGGVCAPGWGNCDVSSDGSCEQDLTGSDARYCGSCTVSCGNCTNDCSATTSKPPVCGTLRETVAPRCYNTIDVWGFKSDNPAYYQGRSATYLHAVRRNVGSSTDPVLFSMGLWEANSGIHYYLALYKGGGTNNYPAALVWSSGLQISQGARGNHYRNEVAVSPPVPLEVGADYWQAVLVYDESGDVLSLEIATHGPVSIRTEDQFAYSGLTIPPVSLLNVPPAADEYPLQSPGLFIRVARP